MNTDVQIAIQFGEAIAGGNFVAAHGLLTKAAQRFNSPTGLNTKFEQMTAYAPGPVRRVEVIEHLVLNHWRDKQEGDIALAYVALQGDSYIEAISVILASEDGLVRIRQLDWGRA